MQIVVISETTFCFYAHNTVALKSLSGKIRDQDKSNLAIRILWSCRRALV